MLNKTYSHSDFKSPLQSKSSLTSNSLNYSAEISFKNKFRYLTKDILKKIDDYKQQKTIPTFDLTQIKAFLSHKISLKKGEYYDFLAEEDPFLLKILIQFLYEELENALLKSKKKQYENMNKIKNMKQMINDYEKLKVSPEPFLLKKKETEESSTKNLKLCLEKLSQFNDMFLNLKRNLWQIINDDVEYEKILFKTEQMKQNFVINLEEIYDKINKTLDNNILFLQSFSIYDYNDDEKSFEEGRTNTTNVFETKRLNSSQNSSPFKNISNENEYNKDQSSRKFEKENDLFQKQKKIRSPFKENDSVIKRFINEIYDKLRFLKGEQ